MLNEANGRQFVAIMAGGRHFMETRVGDELIAYARPAR
jgi:quinoprotein glucose dehydrogenase